MNEKAEAQRSESVSGFIAVNSIGTVASSTKQSLLWALVVETVVLADAIRLIWLERKDEMELTFDTNKQNSRKLFMFLLSGIRLILTWYFCLHCTYLKYLYVFKIL